MRFEKIKSYLNRMRNAEYKILEETKNVLQFEIRNEFSEKLFTIHYSDSNEKDYLQAGRPQWHHYYLQFEQENVPTRNQFCTITEWKWYQGEEDVIQRIKTLKNRYNY